MHVFDYLPDKQEIHKISREWICNIFASVLKNIFTEWVRAKIEERNIEMIEKKELNIELDADVADCFNQSTAVSCKCHLLFYFLNYFYHSVKGSRIQHAQGRQKEKTNGRLNIS